MIMRIPDFDSDEPVGQSANTYYISTEQELINLFLSITDEDEEYIKKMVKKLLQNPESEP